jgi:branched-chain amino acid transport system ATP-binding protein
MPEILEIREVTKRFGGLLAVDSVSMQLQEKEITALIGPNGSGKSTLLNCVSGIYKPESGSIVLDAGTSLTGKAPYYIAQRGVARTFQAVRLFEHLTALENVMVGSNHRSKAKLMEVLLGNRHSRREERDIRQDAEQALESVGLLHRADTAAVSLPYGERRLVEIARALAMKPRVILLDEPAAGMNPTEVAELMQCIRSINAQGVTILLVEHNMRLVMGISQHVVALNFGGKIAEGTPDEIQSSEVVIEAYLGRAASREEVEG